MMGAIRMTKIAKNLVQRGYKVSVITSENSTLLFQKEKCNVDPLLKRDIGEMDVHRVKHGFFYSFVAKILRRFSGNASSSVQSNTSKKISFKKKFLHYILFYMSLWQDKDFSLKGKKIYRKICSDEGNIIISSYGPIASHLLAIKCKRKNDRLICDFRDPIAQNINYKHEFNINRKFEHKFISKADAVVAVSRGYLASLGLTENNQHFVITNGFDSDDCVSEKADLEDSDIISISYVGTLYSGKRDITPLLNALNELSSSKDIDISKIRFCYAGPQGQFFMDICEKNGLSSIARNLGQISRDEAIKLQSKSNCILVLTWNDYDGQGILPGKFYEAMMFGKPILVLVSGPSKNSEIKSMLPKEAGFCFEQASDEDMDYLKKFLIGLSNRDMVFDLSTLHKYEYKSITSEYEKVLNFEEGN